MKNCGTQTQRVDSEAYKPASLSCGGVVSLWAGVCGMAMVQNDWYLGRLMGPREPQREGLKGKFLQPRLLVVEEGRADQTSETRSEVSGNNEQTCPR